MATVVAADTAPPTQPRAGLLGTSAARADHDLAPVMGLATGVGAALLLWAIPVTAWLLLQ